MRRGVTTRVPALLVCVTIVTFSGTTAALGQPSCTDFAPDFAALQQHIGAVMGVPTTCPRVGGDGSTMQVSSTGLAVRRADGMLAFASGDEHWALTGAGLQAWTGNWHNGLFPPVTPQPEAENDATPIQQPERARIEPMLLLEVRQDASNAGVVEDASGSRFTVETGDGCPDLDAAVGDHVFMRSGGSQTDLVLVRQHETCAVAAMHTTD